MKVICAPDSFKESMTASQAAEAMRHGIHSALPDATVDACPIADGGEGTVDALCAAMHGRMITTRVTGPLGDPVEATWAMFNDPEGQPAAIIEMAAAAGLALVPESQRDPTRTHTAGVGQLIDAAVQQGAKKILLGIGGSATTDAGCAAAQAMGAIFYDANDKPITNPLAGGLLSRIKRIDLSPLREKLSGIEIIVACDVTNPLVGPKGAAHVYAPQKGATPDQVKQLDAALTSLANLWPANVKDTPGAGAAGGLGAGLMAMFNATLQPGIDMVLDAVGFAQRLSDCDWCLTGEGKLDGQSLSGKACLGVARAAALKNVPTVAMVGCVGPDVDHTLHAGLHSYHLIAPELAPQESIRRGPELLECAARRWAQTLC